MDRKLRKDFFWNTLGSGFVSFNSLFFLIIVTRINGIKEAGIFSLAYALALLFYVIGLYSGRSYQVTENNENINDCDYVYFRKICVILMLVISIVFLLIKCYDFEKNIIIISLIILKGIEALCDVYQGIMQKNNRIDIVGKSLFFRSLTNIIVFLIVDIYFRNVFIACLFTIISSFCFLIIDYKISLKFINIIKKQKKDNIKLLFKYGFYTFGFTIIANYLVVAPRNAIDLMLDVKYQTIFGIIVMPATIILLITQFILGPLIMKMKKAYDNLEKERFIKLILYLIIGTLIASMLSIILAYFIGVPVLNIIYGIELKGQTLNLILILIGTTFMAFVSIFSNALIIFRKTKIQFYIYIIVSVYSYFSSYLFVSLIGFNGAILSYLTIMMLLGMLYLLTFIKCINKSFKNERSD